MPSLRLNQYFTQRGIHLFQMRNDAIQLQLKLRISSVDLQNGPTGRPIDVSGFEFVFHLSSEMFRFQEFVNPDVDFRVTGVVFPAVVHTMIMVAMLSIDPTTTSKQALAFTIWRSPFTVHRSPFGIWGL